MDVLAKFSEGNSSVVDVQVKHNNGEVKKQRISMNRFTCLLKDSEISLDETIHLGKMPMGYYDSVISLNYESTFECIINRPSMIFPVNFYNSNYEIPFPNLTFYFSVIKGEINQSKVFARKSDIVDDKTLLYFYPFGNVYSDGRICWGCNNFEKISTFADLEYVVKLFYSAPTNLDLFEMERINDPNANYGSLRGLYESLNKKKVFPSDVLVPLYLSLGNLLNY